jgi:uncharacterized cupin superfamily protein
MSVDNIVLMNNNAVDVETYHVDDAKRISGNPLQSLWNHYSDDSNQFHVGMWQSEPGRWKISYSEHEFCQLLEGVSIVHDDNGGQVTLKAGDNFVIPKGFSGEWEVVEATKKIYVIYEPTS